MLAAGRPELRDRPQPVLGAIGSRTVWAEDDLGRVSAVTLACNAWITAF